MSQVLGQEAASEVDVFFNTSLASVRRPIKKTFVATKQTSDSVEVVEVAAKEIEVITLFQSEERAPEEVPAPEELPAENALVSLPTELENSLSLPGAEVSEDAEADAVVANDEQFSRELYALFRLDWDEE